MDRLDMLTLAAECEQAKARDQWGLLSAAYKLVFGGPECIPIDTWPGYKSPRWDRFNAMLKAEAFESAAMTLVAEGWRISQLVQDEEGKWSADLHTFRPMLGAKADITTEWCETLALALCAAALRSRANLNDKQKESDQ